MTPRGPLPGDTPAAPASGGPSDSAFEVAARRLVAPAPVLPRKQPRLLLLAALLGCLGVLLFARWLAAVPHLDLQLSASEHGGVVLRDSSEPALQSLLGRPVLAIATADAGHHVVLDASLLHRAPRWQPDDAARRHQLELQRALAAVLASAPEGRLELHFGAAGGQATTTVQLQARPRGLQGLGLLFWPVVVLASLLLLFGATVVAVRRRAANVLYGLIALLQAINLLAIAAETLPGLGAPAWPVVLAGQGRFLPDLLAGAAMVHALALFPARSPLAPRIAAAAWVLALGVGAAVVLGWTPGTWWWVQAACLALGAGAWWTASTALRRAPLPWMRVTRRMVGAGFVTLLLTGAAVALAVAVPGAQPNAPLVATSASVAWHLFVATMLLLPPFLASSRALLREFTLLAGAVTVAASLELLLVTLLDLDPVASLLLSAAAALGLYAGARRWWLQQLLGASAPSTERVFELLYRAAREVRARPDRFALALARLLHELFEPLSIERADGQPGPARTGGDGSTLVVPLGDAALPASEPRPETDRDAPHPVLVLRYARRGQRLFVDDDARLAERVAEQLRRAVAWDIAVERGRSEERARIAQDLHDDIGARLLTLMYRAPNREIEDYIRHTLQDLKTLTRGLAAAEQRLSHAAAEWKSDLGQRLAAAQAELAWHVEADADPYLSAVQWSALTRVLRELVSNALFHGRASRVEIRLRLASGRLDLSVADDGDGGEPQGWSHGLGLGGVRKRVKLLGGEVRWARRSSDGSAPGIVCEVAVPRFLGR